jgi:hypothetical protein
MPKNTDETTTGWNMDNEKKNIAVPRIAVPRTAKRRNPVAPKIDSKKAEAR